MHKKPIEQKKLEGTYRADRDSDRERAESLVASIGIFYPKDAKLRCPKSIRTKEGRRFWREVTRQNVSLGMLAPVDLPQVERLCLLREEMDRIRELWQEAVPLEGEYERLLSMYLKMGKEFDALADKYCISPQGRSRLALEALNVTKAARDVRQADDGIGALLSSRK